MKQKIVLILVIALSTLFNRNYSRAQSENNLSEIWNSLLSEYVSDRGLVNYEGLLDKKRDIEKYISFLKDNAPQKSWSEPEKLAYWINTYNVNTVWLILEHYPLKSIMDIKEGEKTAWDIKFIEIKGQTYSLNDIENNILRKRFREPRIHFAVNCGAYSCPKLYNKAFVASDLNERLNILAKEFINNKNKNILKQNKIRISRIFEWYGDDFNKEGSLIDFLNKYSDVKISADARVDYLEYDWRLNKQK